MKGSTKLLIAIFITGLLLFIRHCWSIYPKLFDNRYIDIWEEGVIIVYLLICFVATIYSAIEYSIESREEEDTYCEYTIDRMKEGGNYVLLMFSPFTYLFLGISFLLKLSDKYLE